MVRRRPALVVALVATAALAATSSARAHPGPTPWAPGPGGPVPHRTPLSWDEWAADRVLEDVQACAGPAMQPARVAVCARRLLIEHHALVERRWDALGAVSGRITARPSVRGAEPDVRERVSRTALASEAALARAAGDAELADLLGAP